MTASFSTPQPPRIVIVGAGFAGLFCAKGLLGAQAQVTLIDRQNHHLFQPLLYQVATGFLGINDVALPVRSLFRNNSNIEVVMSDVTGVDVAAGLVQTATKAYPYDFLIVAVGSRYHFFGHNEWEKHTLVLKSLEDAIAIRQHILSAFEQAELESDPAKREALITFVVIGGGPTGVEMAGAIADAVNYALKREFRYVQAADVQILMIEAAPRILGAMPEGLSAYAQKVLEEKGVKVLSNTMVKDIQAQQVIAGERNIRSHTILWAAGVRPLSLQDWLGISLDKRGAIPVRDDLSVPGIPNVFVLGDAATALQDDKPLPALASVAKQQGKYVANLLRRRIDGQIYKPFHYTDWGNMATIGRNAAAADFGHFQLKGWLAWIVWGIAHILFLTGFRNRTVVFLTWVWTYLTYGMGARIILRQNSISPKS